MPIEVINVTKKYAEKPALSDFSFSFPDSGLTAVTGPSGSGKTTLLRIIAGLESPDSGRLLATDKKKISFVFQEDRLLPTKTALENIALICSRRTAAEWLELVGMTDSAEKLPRELSGGMQRRVAIARALAYGGDILLLDEPFKGLDRDLHDKIFALIDDFAARASVILVSHDASDISRCPVRVELK